MATDQEFEQANLRGATRRTGPVAIDVRYDPKTQQIVISLSTGFDISFRPNVAEGLQNAMPSDLDQIEISPSGLGIHFLNLAQMFICHHILKEL